MGTTLQQMRSSARQLIAVALAITISIGFVATVLQVGGVIERSAWDAIAAQYNGADAIVTSSTGTPLTASTVNAVRGVSGVATAEGRLLAYAAVSSADREIYPNIAAVPDAAPLRDAIVLASGRLPETTGEVALLTDLADQLELHSGSQATIEPFSTGIPAPITVVGIVDASTQFGGTNAPQLYAWPDDVQAWATNEGFDSILVTANAETAQATLIDRLRETLSGDLDVRTRDQQAEAMMTSVTDGTDLLTLGLLGFAIVALFVAGLVISNTFTILVAQRTRQLALMRCVGATRSQIRQGVIGEAVILSVLASLAGIVIGIGAIQVGIRLIDRIWPELGIATNPSYGNSVLIAPFILGVIATTAAAWGPARRATRVAPLEALRPAAPDVLRSTVTFHRLLITLALVATGSVIMLGGIALSLADTGWGAILISIFGGMISFLGVLVGAVIVVPRVVSFLGGSLSRVGGAPAQIAAANSNRNPRRTTATAAALLIAVTLVTMMSVGAESAKSTLNREIDERSPVDLVIGTDMATSPTNPDQWVYTPLPPSVAAVLSTNDDIEAFASVLQTDGQIDDMGVQILGVAPDQFAQVTRSRRALDTFANGTALFASDLAFNIGLAEGDQIEISVGPRQLPVTVRVADLPTYAVLLTDSDIKQLASTSPTAQIWARMTDDADPEETISAVQDALGGSTDLWYSGGAQDRAANNSVLDTMLWIVTALLGVAIVISLVGVSNTLSLSVLERTRESAVLRAIGLTKRQLRVMLALEGVLLALVGAVIGIVLGTVYGFAGALALIGGTWEVSFSAPIGRIAIIILIAIAAGVLASVIPARNALKTSPVAALAE